MPKAKMGPDGAIKIPEEFLRRRRLLQDLEWWIDQRDVGLILLPRLADLRKLYVEPTTDCNLNCRSCIRNVWKDPKAHMELDTLREIVAQAEQFPDLKRVVFSGLGEPLTHPNILDMVQ